MRRATMAVVDIDTPSPMANTSASIDSVIPTVATAFAPSRPTQNTSVTANSDSSTISSTMGMASRKMARLKISCCVVLVRAFQRLAYRRPESAITSSKGGGINHSRTDIRKSPRWVPRPNFVWAGEVTIAFHPCPSKDETRGRDHAKGSSCDQIVICRITPGLKLTSGARERE